MEIPGRLQPEELFWNKMPSPVQNIVSQVFYNLLFFIIFSCHIFLGKVVSRWIL